MRWNNLSVIETCVIFCCLSRRYCLLLLKPNLLPNVNANWCIWFARIAAPATV